MFKFLLRAPFTLVSLMGEVNQNQHFSIAEKIQAFATLSSLFLRQRFRRQTGLVQSRIFHFSVIAYDFQTLTFLFREVFLSEVYYYKSSYKNPVILDGGANIGMSSLYFKYLYPQCHVIAFEPNPQAVNLFRKNIGLNNLEQIHLLPSGLGKESGEKDFFPGKNAGSLNASFHPSKSGRPVKIQVNKLSGYIKLYKPEMVKLDVEGAEAGIVQELINAEVLAIPKHYLIEYHQPVKNRQAALATFIQIFTSAGFFYEVRKRKTTMVTEDLLLYFYQ